MNVRTEADVNTGKKQKKGVTFEHETMMRWRLVNYEGKIRHITVQQKIIEGDWAVFDEGQLVANGLYFTPAQALARQLADKRSTVPCIIETVYVSR